LELGLQQFCGAAQRGRLRDEQFGGRTERAGAKDRLDRHRRHGRHQLEPLVTGAGSDAPWGDDDGGFNELPPPGPVPELPELPDDDVAPEVGAA